MNRTALLLALLVGACSQGHVETTAVAAVGARPAPSHVVVSDFTVAPGQVQLDSGAIAQIRRERSAQPVEVTQQQIATRAQAALAETLAKRLGEYGLPVERRSVDAQPLPRSLLVQGQFVSINQGNRTRRVMIGLGSGASTMEANAQLYYAADAARPLFMTSFNATADSGRMPGAAETMGVGAAAGSIGSSAAISGGLHAGAEMRRTGEEALADKLAEALAKQIGQYAVSEGWIPATALH
jgi:hypothetical protein